MPNAQGVLAGAKILCVDDHADMLELLCIVLKRAGADVKTCASAEAAIECLKEVSFHVIISDLMMPPGLDGYDLAHAIRKMESDDNGRRRTPMVAVSSDAMTPSKKRRFADFQVYLTKPFNRVTLVHVVELLVEADGGAVALGSLVAWEAEQATKAAEEAAKAAEEATKATETMRIAVDAAAKLAIKVAAATAKATGVTGGSPAQ
jgi:CheY-like chemotaxis protein